LLELSLVAIMVALLAGVVVPRFSDFWRASELRTCARRVAALMVRAHTRSLSTGQPAAVEFDAQNGAFQAAEWQAAEPGSPDGEWLPISAATARPVRLPDYVSLASMMVEEEETAGDSSRVIFFPDGQAQLCSIVLQRDTGDAASIVVSPLTASAKVVWRDVREES
jgi:Tfp pilus assembly protein FimT